MGMIQFLDKVRKNGIQKFPQIGVPQDGFIILWMIWATPIRKPTYERGGPKMQTIELWRLTHVNSEIRMGREYVPTLKVESNCVLLLLRYSQAACQHPCVWTREKGGDCEDAVKRSATRPLDSDIHWFSPF